MHTGFRGKLAVAITVLAGIAFAGGAYAATQDSSAAGRQAFLSDAAKRLNVTRPQLESALQGGVARFGGGWLGHFRPGRVP